MTEQVEQWFWGQHPEVSGWVVAPLDCAGYEPGVQENWDEIENYAGAVMADYLSGEDVEPYLTVVDNMGGPGERIFIETEADLQGIITALGTRGYIVNHDEDAASGLLSPQPVAGDVSEASRDMGCGTHDHNGACNLFWMTDGELGLVTNYCELPASHGGPHVCICGDETDPTTEPGAYFLGG